MKPEMKNNLLLKSALALAIIDLVLIVAILLQVNNLVKDVLEAQNRQIEIGVMREKLKKAEEIKMPEVKAEKKEEEIKALEEQEIKDSLTVDPETGWQVYRNANWRYEIKIPNSWTLRQESPAPERSSKIVFNEPLKELTLTIYTPALGFGMEAGGLKSEEYINLSGANAIKQILSKQYGDTEMRTFFVKWEKRNPITPASPPPSLDSGMILFTYHNNYAQNENLFSQILNTLKFID